MPNKLNQLMKDELKATWRKVAPGCVLIDYTGLKSEQAFALRKELNAKKIRMQVVKNSLSTLAMAEVGIDPKAAAKIFRGPVAVVYDADAVSVAKTLLEWRRKNKQVIEVKGGLLEGKVLSLEDVQRLAALPSKDQLRAQVCGVLPAPIAGCVNATAGILRKLLYAVQAVKEQKEKAAGGAGGAGGGAETPAPAPV